MLLLSLLLLQACNYLTVTTAAAKIRTQLIHRVIIIIITCKTYTFCFVSAITQITSARARKIVHLLKQVKHQST